VVRVVAKDPHPLAVDEWLRPLQGGVGACVVNDNDLPVASSPFELRSGRGEYAGDLVLLIEDRDNYRKRRWDPGSVGERNCAG
jgi:hypothetical protein